MELHRKFWYFVILEVSRRSSILSVFHFDIEKRFFHDIFSVAYFTMNIVIWQIRVIEISYKLCKYHFFPESFFALSVNRNGEIQFAH